MAEHSGTTLGRPTAAFVGASWVALGLGATLFFIGLWNARMLLSEKGFYLAVFLLGLFAAISVQKAVRDRAEDVPVTGVYVGVAWSMLLASLLLMGVGLWNSGLLLSEKGFYGIGFAMSLFAVVAVQDDAAAASGDPQALLAAADPLARLAGGVVLRGQGPIAPPLPLPYSGPRQAQTRWGPTCARVVPCVYNRLVHEHI